MKTKDVFLRGICRHRIETGDCRKKTGIVLIVVWVGLCSLLAPAQSFNSSLETWEPLTSWTLRHQIAAPAPHNLRGVAGLTFGNGQFVVVANRGAIAISSDGRNWTRQVSDTRDFHLLAGVAFGNGLFITVGRGGMISSSTDGKTWAASKAGPSAYFHGVRFVNGRFIAFSRPGSLHISDDGTQWRTIPVRTSLASVAYGNGRYVGVGEDGLGTVGEDVVISSDSTNWTSHASGFGGFPRKLNDVIFADGRFVAVGSAGLIATSPDGAAWSNVPSGVSDELYGINYSNGRYAIVGGNHTDPFSRVTSVVLTSTNAVTWTRNDSGTPASLVAITSGNGMFAAIGNEGNGITAEESGAAQIIISPDGRQWRSSGGPINLRSVTFGGDSFVAVGDNGSILVSSDSLNWTAGRNRSGAHLKDAAYGNGIFVAVGTRGTILSSTNAADWEERMSGTRIDLQGVKFAGDSFVAVGGSREVLFDGTFGASEMVVISSRDGIQWTPRSFTGMGSLSDIAFGGGIFLGVGSMHFHDFVGWTVYALQSTNGLSWSQVQVPLPPEYYSRIEYGNGRFLALSFRGMATTLADANEIRASWKLWSAEPTVLSGLGFGRNTFLALSPGAIFASVDGDSWKRLETGQATAFYDVVYGRRSFVAVGENGTVFQSGVFEDSKVMLANAAWINGRFQVEAQTKVGQEYTLEFKDGLEEQAWKALTPVVGTGSMMIFSDSNPTGRQRFYRVRVR